MEPVRFAAAWDGRLTAITAGTVLLFVAGVALVVWVALQFDSVAASVAVSLLALPGLVTLAVTYGWSPRGYTIDEQAVRIERAVGPVVLPLSSLRGARELASSRRLRRVLGSGGLSGYFGTYRSAELGTVSLFATRSRRRVLLETERGPVVLTPEPSAVFLDTLRERLP